MKQIWILCDTQTRLTLRKTVKWLPAFDIVPWVPSTPSPPPPEPFSCIQASRYLATDENCYFRSLLLRLFLSWLPFLWKWFSNHLIVVHLRIYKSQSTSTFQMKKTPWLKKKKWSGEEQNNKVLPTQQLHNKTKWWITIKSSNLTNTFIHTRLSATKFNSKQQ